MCELKQINVSQDTLCLGLLNGFNMRVAARETKKKKKTPVRSENGRDVFVSNWADFSFQRKGVPNYPHYGVHMV